MTQPTGRTEWTRVTFVVWAIVIALGLNALAWVAAALWPNSQQTWTYVSLFGFFLLGLFIGRWWALMVTCAFSVIHAIPVYLGLLPGYLSTWGEALWWVFALAILLSLTSLGVLSRRTMRWLLHRSSSRGTENQANK